MPKQERLNGHAKFGELCALAMSGTLGAEERAELDHHLQTCDECREAYKQFLVLTKHGMPMLAAVYGRRPEELGTWDDSQAREKLFARVAATEKQAPVEVPILHSARPSYTHVLRSVAVHPLARPFLAACLVVVVALGAYRLGRRTEAVPNRAGVTAEDGFRKLAADKKSVDELLEAQNQKVSQLETQGAQKQQQVVKLRSALHGLEGTVLELAAARDTSEQQLGTVSQQRDVLAGQLRAAEQAYRSVQAELASLRAERNEAVARLASLESRVAEISAENRDQERRLGNQEQYLASDRDIREIMGARQLYIADVFDVSSNSRTRKPYGRVFYTKGKSLIFYAFDLDRQPGVRPAATFQAWGRKESDQGRPRNLGILFMDNEANRRWMLRVDDPVELAEIDAVFVTIEPHGGSAKPTGKPFLYASLRKEPNHP